MTLFCKPQEVLIYSMINPMEILDLKTLYFKIINTNYFIQVNVIFIDFLKNESIFE